MEERIAKTPPAPVLLLVLVLAGDNRGARSAKVLTRPLDLRVLTNEP